MKERILRNIFSHGFGRLFEMALGLILIPFLIRVLGATGFGLIILAEAVIRFFDIGVSGLITGIGRHIGICFAQDDKEGVNSYIASGEKILLIALLAFAVIGGLLCYYFGSLFNISPAFQGQIKVFMFMMILSILLQIRFTSKQAILYSFQRFDLLNIYNVSGNITRCLLSFLVYSLFSPKLYYYGFIYFAAVGVKQILIVRGARKLFPELPPRTRRASWAKTRELLSFWGLKTLQVGSSLLYSDTDMILINRFLGPYFNAVYSVSLKFVQVMRRLIMRSLYVVVPSFTELLGKNEHKKIGLIYSTITKSAALLSLPLCIIIALFGRELIVLWVGKDFLDAVNPMYINILAFLPSLVFATSGGISTAYAKIKFPSYVALSCAIGNVFLSLFCAIKLGWGLAGFAFGTLVAAVVNNLMFQPYYACRIAGMDFKRYYFNSFLKPLLLNGVLGALVFYLKFVMKVPIAYVLGCLALLFPLYMFISYTLILNSYERSKIKELTSGAVSFLKGKRT